MYKQIHNIIKAGYPPFAKIVYTIFFTLSLCMIFFGISGIIEHKSPENLASLAKLSSGFVSHFEYHALIIFGALFFTFAVLSMRNKSR